jgi:hypothetical protein
MEVPLLSARLAKESGSSELDAAAHLYDKRAFAQRKAGSAIYAGGRVAKSCCFIESIGDRFAQW